MLYAGKRTQDTPIEDVMKPSPTILTIGHSTHSREYFESLLTAQGVTAIADVRSAPFSRWSPQFNRDELKASLGKMGIAYSFLGRELGGRPKDALLYCEGVADYELMARTSIFRDGIDRVLKGTQNYRIALLCSEHDPLDCHRCLLVSRELAKRGSEIQHILSDGSLQDQTAVEKRLRELTGLREDDLFASAEEQLAAAYRYQSSRVAFSEISRPPNAVSG